MSLLDTSTSSHEGSQTELTSNDSFSLIKPDLSEKAKQFSQRLQDSLSSNIMEAKRKKEEEEEGDDKSQSVSPVSIVSSSGAVQGEYVVNPEEQGEGIQEEEKEEEEEEGDDENDEDFGKFIIIR